MADNPYLPHRSPGVEGGGLTAATPGVLTYAQLNAMSPWARSEYLRQLEATDPARFRAQYEAIWRERLQAEQAVEDALTPKEPSDTDIALATVGGPLATVAGVTGGRYLQGLFGDSRADYRSDLMKPLESKIDALIEELSPGASTRTSLPTAGTAQPVSGTQPVSFTGTKIPGAPYTPVSGETTGYTATEQALGLIPEQTTAVQSTLPTADLSIAQALWGGQPGAIPTAPGTGTLGLAQGSALAPALAAAPLAAEVATQSYEGINKIIDNLMGEDKDLSFREEAALALPTFGLSFAYDPVRKFFGSGKGPEQQARDELRSQLQDIGFIDEDYNVRFAGGETFDIGRDVGGEPYFNVGFGAEGTPENLVEFTQTPEFEEQYGGIIGALNPISGILAQGDQKLTSDLTGYLTNAIMQTGGEPDAKVQDLVTQATGLSDMEARNAIGSSIWQMYHDGLITSAERNARLAANDKLYGVANPTGYVAPLDPEDR